jgi:hypothetical protein
MAKPFKGKIELDIRDSVLDWDAFLPGQAPEEAASSTGRRRGRDPHDRSQD